MMQGDSKALVSQGVAGTGAAVIYDTNKFNPVQFMQDAANEIRQEKQKKEIERAKATAESLKGMEVVPEGLFWQKDVLDVAGAHKNKWANPMNIGVLSNPADPRYVEFVSETERTKGVANMQKQMNTLLANDLAKLRDPNMAGKIDPASAEEVKRVTSMPLSEAYRMYQENGGTLIKPAYDIKDLVGEVTYAPSEVAFEVKGNNQIERPVIDEEVLSADIDAVMAKPEMKPVVDYFITKYGGDEDKVKAEIRRLYNEKVGKPKITQVRKPSAGRSSGSDKSSGVISGGVANDYFTITAAFDKSQPYVNEGEVNVIPVGYKGGKTPPPFTYTKYDEKTRASSQVNMVPAQIVRKVYPNGEATYEVVGKQYKRVGEVKKTADEIEKLLTSGAKYEFVNGVDETEGAYEIQELPEVRVVLNDVNNAAFIAQTGIDAWKFINSENNKRGTNKASKPAQTSSTSTTTYKGVPQGGF